MLASAASASSVNKFQTAKTITPPSAALIAIPEILWYMVVKHETIDIRHANRRRAQVVKPKKKSVKRCEGHAVD